MTTARRLSALLLAGATLLAIPTAAVAATVTGVAAAAQPAPDIVYGMPHVEAVLSDALAKVITAGRLQMEMDNRAVELRAPQGAGSLAVENLYYSPVQGRFAAEIVVTGTQPQVRLPVSGRAFGVVQIPVLTRRVVPGDIIGPGDVDWQDMRADQTTSDTAATDIQLVGMTPKRGISTNQPVRLRDLQSPRMVDKGAMVTITLATPSMTLTTQGKALQDGGRGEVIRVVNTQSNRIVEATVAGPNVVAVAKPGTIAQ
ncbi:flagellar basal body P-ring formation chaperone FlgA [Azospirillum picis]|uniref:Flagella basal body P-ring formation protein FlgA n=1 Tax=Azospirillum picis TaxID=488438 RepID=A0ABU0MFF4_9PROT|nr:flagellar basal body P-ring formation chaperone FlgA [Azospirillum picis]MBP2298781.1 flagella basal body P-ring formation protein FlgA [Azospirillum picis]MDQ0532170.1 flagella basal body P-ring formation protein FlgA [Azospirillum picis]